MVFVGLTEPLMEGKFDGVDDEIIKKPVGVVDEATGCAEASDGSCDGIKVLDERGSSDKTFEGVSELTGEGALEFAITGCVDCSVV